MNVQIKEKRYYCVVMLRPSFDIVPANADENVISDSTLILEIGEKMFSYLLFNRAHNKLVALKYFYPDTQAPRPMSEMIAEVLASDSLLSLKYKETVVIYSFPESSMVPVSLSNEHLDRAVTQLVYGNVQKGLILREPVEGWDMVNIYRIPRELQSFIEQEFSPSKYYHVYSLLLISLNREGEDRDLLKIRFYPDRFIAMLIRQGTLQIIQSFIYQTPDDVSYNLLAIAEQFDIDPTAIQVMVSGTVDKQSALYNELEKYFLHIQSEEAANVETNGMLGDYPEHYFSPLLKFAECV